MAMQPDARHDLVWDDLGGYVYHGAMLGNGTFGALVHRQDPGRWDGDGDTLLWQVNRTDAVEIGPRQQEGYRWARMALGRFLLRPSGRIQRIALTLDLAAAELRGAIVTDRGALRLRSIVCAERDVLVLEIDAEGDEAVRELAFAADPSGVIADTGPMDLPERATYDPVNPPARRLRQGEIEMHAQDQPHAGRWWRAAWLRRDQQRRTTLLATIAYSHPQVGPAADPVAVIADAAHQGSDALVAAHRRWWAAHYARCALVLPDDPAMEGFWWLQQYKFGCTMRADGPLMDLCGP